MKTKIQFKNGDIVFVDWPKSWYGVGVVVRVLDGPNPIVEVKYKTLPNGGFDPSRVRLATDAEALAWRLAQ